MRRLHIQARHAYCAYRGQPRHAFHYRRRACANDIGNASVTNADDIGYGTITLAQALAVSSNTAFGQFGEEVGSDLLVKTAQKFGFGSAIDTDIPTTQASCPTPTR